MFTSEMEPISDLMKPVNKWIESNFVEVISIETILIPRNAIRSPDSVNSTESGRYHTGTGIMWLQCIRVWYREK